MISEDTFEDGRMGIARHGAALESSVELALHALDEHPWYTF
jgi:hypothetical protein